jgi:hypothetical protein
MLTVRFEIFEEGLSQERFSDNTTSRNQKMELEELVSYLKFSLKKIALEVLKEEQDKGFDDKPVKEVDGILNKSEDQVKPFGKIEYTARVAAADFLIPIYKRLIEKSPLDTGLYRDYHYVLLNEVLIATNLVQFSQYIEKAQFKEGDSLRFVNMVPYASKLERFGVTTDRAKTRYSKSTDKKKRSGMFVRQPNGVYFLTAKSINKNFKSNAKIKFEWINGSRLTGIDKPSVNRRGKKLRYSFKSRKGYYTHPSIVVRFSTGGIL